MQRVAYVLACIFVPAIWGLAVSFFFEMRDRRKRTGSSEESKEMYYI
ncbi:MAG: hypothetical protein ABJA67_08165 [Chthonomonadales bacterium]